ncbi:MAG: tyrosine-type recombinase/integrase, partial [Lentilitoribacter sp.]
AINEFAANGIAIQNVDRKATRAYVRHLSTEKGLKNKTIRDRLSFLGMYWNWLVYQDLAPEDVPNPFARVELPKENCKDAAKDTRLPFTVSDITKLHTSIVASDQKTLQVAFMLAIHSGCRIEEIASLENASISENSIVIYSAKSPSGNRTIPLHPTSEPLVSALKARGGQYLLPDLTVDRFGGRSANIGRAFSKIKSGLKYDGRYVFHSLRKTVATQLEQAGVPEGIAADILGHQKKTMSYGLYSGGSSFEQKRDAIMKLDYALGKWREG